MDENKQTDNNQPETPKSEQMPEQTSQQDDTSASKMEEKKDGGKNKLIIILVVLVVICIICSIIGFVFSNLVADQVNENLDDIGDQIERELEQELQDLGDIETTPEETEVLESNRESTSKASDFMSFNQNGISIDYPKNWTNEPSSQPSIIFQALSPTTESDQFSENVNISTESTAVQPNITLDEYVDISLENLENSYNSISYELQGETVLAGKAAYEIVYTISGDEVGLPNDAKVLQVIALVDDEAFIFTYTGLVDEYDNYVNEVNYMINSFMVN